MQTRLPMPQEYVEELRKNKYVLKATEWIVSFTPEFQQIAYDEHHNGKSIRQIFIEAGFDLEIIGEKRLYNFQHKLIKKVNSGNSFDPQQKSKACSEKQSTEAQMAKRIRELEHRNTYLEQENNFLKKIQFLEKECSGKAGKRK